MKVKKRNASSGTEKQNPVGENRMKLAVSVGTGVLAVALLIGGIALTRSCGKESAASADLTVSVQEAMDQFLESADGEQFIGVETLSEEERQILLETVIASLESQMDKENHTVSREETVEAVSEKIRELDLGLSSEVIRELAEKFVELYEKETIRQMEKREKESHSMDEAAVETLRTELQNISNYLTELDKQITNNQTVLEQMTGGTFGQDLAETKEELSAGLTALQENYQSLQSKMNGYDKKLSDYLATYSTATTGTNSGIVTLHTSLQDVNAKLTQTEESIQGLLGTIENSQNSRQDSLMEQFSTVKENLSKTESLIDQVKKETETALEELKEQGKEEQQEMVSLLETMQDELNGSFAEQKEQIDQRFGKVTEHMAAMEQGLTAAVEEQTTELRSQMEQSLVKIQDGFSSTGAVLDSQKELLSAFREEYQEQAEASDLKLEEIDASLSKAQESITASEKKVTDTLATLEEAQQLWQEDVIRKLNEISASAAESQEQLHTVEVNITAALTKMQEKSNTDHAELIAGLEQMQSEIQSSIASGSEATDQEIKELKLQMESGFSSLQESTTSGISTLQTQMSDIHQQIQSAQEEIRVLMTDMDKKGEEQYENVMQAIEEAVSDINEDVDTAYNNLQALIRVFNADVAENHRNTLDTLEEMEEGLSDFMSENLEQINQSFASLDTSLEEHFAKMESGQGDLDQAVGTLDQNMGTLGTELKEKLQSMLQSLLDSFAAHDAANQTGQREIKAAIQSHQNEMLNGQEAMKNSISGYDASMRDQLTQFQTSMNEKLTSVFQSVSSGKQKLASALLTKGVSVDQDATFEELKNAVLSIPETIEVSGMPGTIEYDYHYHTNGAGERVGEQAHLNTSGGCYTTAVYHTHNNSCYNWTHEHTDNCPGHSVWVDWNPSVPEGYWGWIPDCGNQPANTRGSLKCTLPTSSDGTPIYYEKACGLSDGQIIAAHIVYENAVGMTKAKSRRIESTEVMMQIVEKEPEFPEAIENQMEEEAGTTDTELEEMESEGTETEQPVIPETGEPESVTPEISESETESVTPEPDESEAVEPESSENKETTSVEITSPDVSELTQTEISVPDIREPETETEPAEQEAPEFKETTPVESAVLDASKSESESGRNKVNKTTAAAF